MTIYAYTEDERQAAAEVEAEELLQEARDAALDEPMEERRYRRNPGDFYDHPSNEQMEYFKKGGR